MEMDDDASSCYDRCPSSPSVNNYLFCGSDDEGEEVHSYGNCEAELKSEEKKGKRRMTMTMKKCNGIANDKEESAVLKSDEEEEMKIREEEDEKERKSDEDDGAKQEEKRKSDEDDKKEKEKVKEKRRKVLSWVEGFDNTPSLLSSSHSRPKTITIDQDALDRAREADLKIAYDNRRKKKSLFRVLYDGFSSKIKKIKLEQVEDVIGELRDATIAASRAKKFNKAVQLFRNGENIRGIRSLASIKLYNADDCNAFLYPPSPCHSSQSSCSRP